MKRITLIYLMTCFLIISCKTNNFEEDGIIQKTTFSDKNYYKYIDEIGYTINKDSFKPVLYSNVKPLEENKNFPQKIFAIQSYYDDSRKYFYQDLKGKSVSYLKRNDKIVFRHYYQVYDGNKSKNKNPKNKVEVINWLNKNKINFKTLKSYQKEGSDILDLNINNQFVRIVATDSFCESYSSYDIKDSVNIETYRTIIGNFYK